MVIAFYEQTVFERTFGNVIIVAILVLILVFHVQLIKKILRSEKTGKGKRIIGMLAVASSPWVIGIWILYAIINAGFFFYGFHMAGFVISMSFCLVGAFLLWLGSSLGYDIAF